MDQFWKLFAGLGTDSKPNVFFKARLKLTALYVLIVAIIIFGFSVFLYQNVYNSLKSVADDDFADTQSHYNFIYNTLQDVRGDLIFTDLVILIITAGFSFILAEKTLKPIQQSLEAQKTFAENASHEFRTPLTVMKNDIEIYLREISPSKELTKTTMRSNLEEINHMSSVVEDLLLLARLDNEIIFTKADVDIGLLVKKTISRMESAADKKNIKLTCDVPESLIISGIQNSLERVILNILQNSIHYTPSGGSVITKVEKDGSKAVIRIRDTGVGISSEYLPHILKRFYKGNSTEGTGLGLSIVKSIVDQHNGDIFIKSVVGKGTTVTIKFATV